MAAAKTRPHGPPADFRHEPPDGSEPEYARPRRIRNSSAFDKTEGIHPKMLHISDRNRFILEAATEGA